MIVLFPTTGTSPHFSPEDYAYPRPLIEVAGKPMILWAIAGTGSAALAMRRLRGSFKEAQA